MKITNIIWILIRKSNLHIYFFYFINYIIDGLGLLNLNIFHILVECTKKVFKMHDLRKQLFKIFVIFGVLNLVKLQGEFIEKIIFISSF
jgi:hypothetical protein